MIKTCKHCEVDFELDSPAKKKAGGKINECSECVEELETETAVRYLGVAVNDDPEHTLSIISFSSEESRRECSSSLINKSVEDPQHIEVSSAVQDKENDTSTDS